MKTQRLSRLLSIESTALNCKAENYHGRSHIPIFRQHVTFCCYVLKAFKKLGSSCQHWVALWSNETTKKSLILLAYLKAFSTTAHFVVFG